MNQRARQYVKRQWGKIAEEELREKYPWKDEGKPGQGYETFMINEAPKEVKKQLDRLKYLFRKQNFLEQRIRGKYGIFNQCIKGTYRSVTLEDWYRRAKEVPIDNDGDIDDWE